MKYRVLMEDKVNSKKFNFAIFVEADSAGAAESSAIAEFPGASIVEVREVGVDEQVDRLLRARVQTAEDFGV